VLVAGIASAGARISASLSPRERLGFSSNNRRMLGIVIGDIVVHIVVRKFEPVLINGCKDSPAAPVYE
jgi:hypothetical protein